MNCIFLIHMYQIFKISVTDYGFSFKYFLSNAMTFSIAALPGAPIVKRLLTQVSMENLLRWQPDIILVQEAVTADFIRRDPLWQGVKAVAEQRILFLSGLPFGWLDAPPGINRLLGLRRLHAWLDPAINRQFKSDIQHYAQLFWHCSLSDADYQKLVAS